MHARLPRLPCATAALAACLFAAHAAATELDGLVAIEGGALEPGTLFQWSYGAGISGGPEPEEPLITDRPDFTESSVTVGRGLTQLEFGYTYFYDTAGGTSVRSETYPELLIRRGIWKDWLELRIAWSYAEERTRTEGMTVSGFSGSEDLSLGVKLALTGQEGLLPEMAIVPQFSIPSGSAGLRDNEVLPGLAWFYGWDITDGLSTAGGSQILGGLDEATGRDFAIYAQSWTVGFSLTERLASYLEWFAFVPSGADSEQPQHFLNGGFTYQLNNDLQLDVRGGVGLNEAAEDFFLGTGWAVRY
jgi:hypothetical protein